MISKLKFCHRLIASPLISYNKAFFSVFNGKNYYQILEVTQTATPDQIKQAFLRLAKIYHPDAQGAKGQKGPDSEEAFKQVLEAYNTLSDKKKREDYDNGLKNKNSAGEKTQKRGGFKTAYRGFHRTAQNQESNTQYEQTYSAGNNQQEWYNDPQAYEKSRAWAQRESEKSDDLYWFMKLEWVFFGLQAVKDERTRMARRGEVTDEDLDREDEEAMYYSTRPDQHTRIDRFSNLKKKEKKTLTLEDCKVMTIEQLVDMHKLGYVIPSPYKERVLEYSHVYEELPRIAYETKVERMKKRAMQYNIPEQTKKIEPIPNVQQPQESEQKTDNTTAQKVLPDKSFTTPTLAEEGKKEIDKKEPASSDNKKKKTLRINEILNPIREIAKSEVFETSEKKAQDHDKDSRNEENVGASQVRVPRMGGGMYGYKKNESF